MKVLLDECLPKKLKYELEADEATTVPEAGWASKTNGELLSLAETDFDVFLTRDQNLECQQNLKSDLTALEYQLQLGVSAARSPSEKVPLGTKCL